jgi:hypothetical protein
MADKDLKEIAHFRVKLIVEELDGNGEVIEVGSENVLADFPNDDDGTSIGQMSDDFFNEVIRKIGRV